MPLVLAANNGGYFWTDALEIGEGAIIRTSLHDLLSALGTGIEGHYYRPTVFFLHSLDFAMFGDRPAAFRLTNLVLHEANALLIYRLIRRVWSDERGALVTAALFAVHPLAATPLAWISDRTDLVALTTSLGFFCLVETYLRRRAAIHLLAAAGCLLVGLGAKETVAATLLISAACVMGATATVRRPLIRVIVLQGAVTAVWFVWRHRVATNSVQYVGQQLAFVDRLTIGAYIHLDYARQLLVPYSLTVCDGMRIPRDGAAWIAGGVLLLGAGGALAWVASKRRDSPTVMALIWAFSFLVPSSGIVPLKHVRADRYLYCALPALIYLVTRGWRALPSRLPRTTTVSVLLFISCYAYLSVALVLRGRRFATDASLWSYETRRNDACLEGYSYLAHSALAADSPAEALAYCGKAARVSPDLVAYVDTDGNTYLKALALVELGDMPEASTVLMGLLRGSDNRSIRSEAAYELGLIEIQKQNYQAGVNDMDLAMGIGPSEKSARDVLLLRAYAYLHLGNREAARRDLLKFDAATSGKLDSSREELLQEVRTGLSN